MDNIPPEILHLVISYVAKDDWPDLRLVNSYFAKITTPLLFEEVSAYAALGPLRLLENITKAPHLAECVRKVYYHGATLKPVVKVDRLFARYFAGSLGVREERYDDLVYEQKKIREHDGEDNVLSSLFAACPAIKELSFSDGHVPAKFLHPAEAEIFHSPGINPSRQLGIHSEWTFYNAGADFNMLLPILEESNVELEKLSLFKLDWTFFTRGPDLWEIFEPLASLRTLLLNIQDRGAFIDGVHEHFGDGITTDVIGRCLAGMENLRQLSITVSGPAVCRTDPGERLRPKPPLLTGIILPSMT